MRKSIQYLITFALMSMLMSSQCQTESKSDIEVAKKTERAMQEANNKIGYPAVKNFHEKLLVKKLYEIRDRADFHTVVYIETKSGIYYIGEAMGFGINASIQYSNPQKVVDGSATYGYLTLPQPEPNGLFMPEGLSATYVMLINDSTGKVEPAYVESNILVFPYSLKKVMDKRFNIK